MLYREMIAVRSEIHINTLCKQNVELLTVKPGGTYSDHFNYRFSPYRAVNTLPLGYTNQSVNAV